MELYELRTTSNGVTVSSGSMWEIEHGGVAKNFKVSSGGEMYVFADGKASGTVVSSGGTLSFESGCLSGDGTQIQLGGTLYVKSGAVIDGIQAANGAILKLCFTNSEYNGIKAVPTSFDISSNGSRIFCANGKLNGWDMKTPGCYLDILDGASAGAIKVSSGCSMDVGGFAAYGHYPAAVEKIDVYNGGCASLNKPSSIGLATVHAGGSMYVGKYAENTTVMENGGYLSFADQSILTPDEYYDQNVKIKPNTFSKLTIAGANGKNAGATVHSGTTAASTTLKNDGWLYVFSDGRALNTFVSSGGYLIVSSGGVASGIQNVLDHGMVHISSGGRVTGVISLKGGGSMIVDDGGVIDFDISGIKPNNSVLFAGYNGIPFNVGNPSLVLTVSGTQAKGTYNLASDAAQIRLKETDKEKTLAIHDTSGMKVGSVLVGKKTKVGNQTYALNLSNAGDLTLTVAAYVEGEDIWYEKWGFSDGGWNNVLCNKSKYLVPDALEFVSTAISESTTDILLDRKNTVLKDGKKNYVGGGGDETDFAKITMKDAAKLSLTISATDAAKFTVWRLIPGRNDTYTMKQVQAATLKLNNQTGEYEASTTGFLADKGEEFYISMESTNAKKGAEAFYNVQVNKADSVFYTKGNNGDDWDDREENGADGNVDKSLGQLKTGKINNLTDLYRDWVGFGDTVDYKRLKLQTTEKLFLFVDATDAVQFSVYALNDDNSLKKVLSTKLSKNKRAKNEYYVLKDVVLDAGDYYFCVELANPKKGGDADYTVSLAGYSYNKAVNTDDSLDTAKNLGTMLGPAARTNSEVLYNNWVGWRDEYDYMKFTLACAARLRFYISSDESTVLFLGDCNSRKTIQKTAVKKSRYSIDGCEATTKEILLEAGDYYLCMQSTNATKYGYSDYSIELYNSVFFADGDDNTNDFLLDAKKKLNANAGKFQSNTVKKDQEILVDKQGSFSQKIDNVTYKNFVGFGDEADYAKITLSQNGKLRFTVTATDAAKFTLYKLVPGRKETFTAKSLLSGKLAKGRTEKVYSYHNVKGIQLLSGEVYYICVESTNAKKSEYGTYYNVSVEYEPMQDVREGKLSSALSMPAASFGDHSDSRNAAGAEDVTDPSEGLISAFADGSVLSTASALDVLQDGRTSWQNIANLA